MKRLMAALVALVMVLTACGIAVAEEPFMVGVSMPTQSLQRWNQDGANVKTELEAAGYQVDLQYADNDTDMQISQIENMIAAGCDALIIAAIDNAALANVLADAGDLLVISYDRLITDTDNIDYYISFDNYRVGVFQAQYVIDTLDLANAAAEGKTYNIEFTAGDPADTNAGFFFNGAVDTLKPYLDSGVLNVVSGQTSFEEVATLSWNTEEAMNRMDDVLASYYADGTILDVALCSNDSTALGVTQAIANSYGGDNWPLITGQDCDTANVANIIDGRQAMSVFKDTRELAAKAVEMVVAYDNGEEIEVNDTETYNNNNFVVPSYLCDPTVVTVENWEEMLIDSGYYVLGTDGYPTTAE